MVYRVGEKLALESGTYDVRVINADEWEQAQADGWHLDQYAAKAAQEAASKPAPADVPGDDAPPTRAELEQKAQELGIKFDGRWGDKKLSEAIAAKLG